MKKCTDNKIGDEGAKALRGALLMNTTLKELDLTGKKHEKTKHRIVYMFMYYVMNE